MGEGRGVVETARETARALLGEVLPRRWAHTRGVAGQARTLASVLGGAGPVVEAAAWVHDVGYHPDLVVTGLHALDGARWLREHGPGTYGPDAHGPGSHVLGGPAVDDPLVSLLVAHHTGALVEAEERGLREVLLAEFPLAAGATGVGDVPAGDTRAGEVLAGGDSAGGASAGDVSGGDVRAGSSSDWGVGVLVDALTWCDLTTTPDGGLTDPNARLAEILTRYDRDHPVHRAVTRSRPGLLASCRRTNSRLGLGGSP